MLETKKKPKITESKRADKKRSIVKVLKEVVKEPIQTIRDISKKTWLWTSTVNRALNDLAQNGTKIQEIQDICEKDFKIIELVQWVTIQRLSNPENESFQDIIRAWAESTKRYSLFIWNATDSKWWLKLLTFDQIRQMSAEELYEYRKSLIK